MDSGLLTKFIQHKISEYRAIEPIRKGTKRGEKIGVMLPKFQAALLCLTAAKLKDIASGIGVSPDLFYVWRTEESFKKLVTDLETEFISLFWINAKKYTKKYEERYMAGIADNLDLHQEYFGNVTLCSFNLKKRIMNEVPMDFPRFYTATILSLLVHSESKDPKEKKFREIFNEYNNKSKLIGHDHVRSVVELSSMSPDDKKYVLFYLDTIRHNIVPDSLSLNALFFT